VFKLRDFACNPAKGSTKGVDYTQTMGKITLTHVFKPEVAHLQAKDLFLELSSWELKVRVEGKPDFDEHLTAINGDLHADVRRDLSWWTLEKKDDGRTLFTIELAKRDHKSWNAVWKVGMNHQRKAHFGWNSSQKGHVRKAEEMLVRVKPGRPERKERFIINRENLCAGLEDGQDATTVTWRVHFDRAALEKACESCCLASLFGVDVMERHLKIFIRGDEKSPIMLGELGGACIPDLTRWEIIKALPPADGDDPQQVQKQQPRKAGAGQYVSCLQITIAKGFESRKIWKRTIDENEIALEREKAPMIDELQQKCLKEEEPDRTHWTPGMHAAENKTKADACFKKSEWRDASVHYTRAINHTPEDEKLYSNRSACYTKLKKFEKALADANKCISLKQQWPKAYFRQGQALRGLERWEEAISAFAEGRFREPTNPDWSKEIEKTEDARDKYDAQQKEQRRLKREADMTAELNEATAVAEQQAMVQVAEQALKMGKSRKEASEMALKSAELAKKRMQEMAQKRKETMMVEDDKDQDRPPPYRIVQEDGTLHPKSFAHTEKGSYFMGMVIMNSERAPSNQVWIETWHPGKLRWSQGCALLRLKVTLPESLKSAADVSVECSATHLRIGTMGDSDAIVVGEFEGKVDPEGENFSWFLIPDEKPPLMELTIDKAKSEVFQTFSYGTLLWSRLFSDDVVTGDGLFEADLTDLPPHLLEKYMRENHRANLMSLDEKNRRAKMTEEEIYEETGRNWNDEFAKAGMPQRLDTNEDRMMSMMKY